jgi:hypothetical protein
MKEQGIDEIADFRFGTDSSKLVTTTDKALSSMGKESWAKDSFSFRRGCYNQKGVICIISPRMIQMISIVFTGKLCKKNFIDCAKPQEKGSNFGNNHSINKSTQSFFYCENRKMKEKNKIIIQEA